MKSCENWQAVSEKAFEDLYNFIHTTRIPRIRCVACLKRQPFDVKKEKKTLVHIIAPIPKDD